MSLGNVARVIAVSAACFAAVGSATSTSNNPPNNNAAPQGAANSPPPSVPMEPARALGLWRSTFGAVKIEADNSKGGLASGSLQGVWVYQRKGEEVVGYFSGNLRGNVFQFRWQEPNNPPLTGEGYLVFEQSGRQYNGRWWSDRKERVGDWNGWRQAAGPTQMPNGQGGQQPYTPPDQNPYGGRTYGGQPAPTGPYGGQGYGTPQPYGPAPQRYPQPQQPQPYGPAQPAPPYGQPQQPQQGPQPPPRPGYY